MFFLDCALFVMRSFWNVLFLEWTMSEMVKYKGSVVLKRAALYITISDIVHVLQIE